MARHAPGAGLCALPTEMSRSVLSFLPLSDVFHVSTSCHCLRVLVRSAEHASEAALCVGARNLERLSFHFPRLKCLDLRNASQLGVRSFELIARAFPDLRELVMKTVRSRGDDLAALLNETTGLRGLERFTFR